MTARRTSASQRDRTDQTCDDMRWALVAARDTASDGQFVYSVATTGVYCRPSCPSRRANRCNVAFHGSCDAAEAAGFRACRRCNPRGLSAGKLVAEKIAVVCRAIEASEPEPNLAELAALAGLSPFHFHRVFKHVTGVTPKAYARAHRHQRVRNTLRTSKTVTHAILDAGFTSAAGFYADSTKILGMTPKRYQAGGFDTDLQFAIGECSLGAILIAATPRGVAAVLMGDEADALLRDLQERFPKARLIGGDNTFDKFAARVIAAVERPGVVSDLPIDVQGTVFQHKVWAALQRIPAGETASYQEIAHRIGMPKACRAVAQACGANPAAVVIPCHRVVRTDGGLSGYRWGIARKQALLEREAKNSRPKK